MSCRSDSAKDVLESSDFAGPRLQRFDQLDRGANCFDNFDLRVNVPGKFEVDNSAAGSFDSFDLDWDGLGSFDLAKIHSEKCIRESRDQLSADKTKRDFHCTAKHR